MARVALPCLRLALTAVLGLQGLAFALAPATGPHAEVAPALRLAVGLPEAVGAFLLLPSRTRAVGAALLAACLAAAAGLHLWLGQRPPLSFLVYLPALAVAAQALWLSRTPSAHARDARASARHAAIRSYRWWSPPTCDNSITLPSSGPWTVRGAGASPFSDRWQRLPL